MKFVASENYYPYLTVALGIQHQILESVSHFFTTTKQKFKVWHQKGKTFSRKSTFTYYTIFGQRNQVWYSIHNNFKIILVFTIKSIPMMYHCFHWHHIMHLYAYFCICMHIFFATPYYSRLFTLSHTLEMCIHENFHSWLIMNQSYIFTCITNTYFEMYNFCCVFCLYNCIAKFDMILGPSLLPEYIYFSKIWFSNFTLITIVKTWQSQFT